MHGKQTLILRAVWRAPVLDDDVVDFGDVQAVTLRNAGTATVQLMNNTYTLDPGETLHINVPQDTDASLRLNNLIVVFDTTTGASKKLQILLIKKEINC